MFYHAGLPVMMQLKDKVDKHDKNMQEIMKSYPDVPFYLYQPIFETSDYEVTKIHTHVNPDFDTDYIKVRGNQSAVILDGIKTIMHSRKLQYLNDELREGNFTQLKQLLLEIRPLYEKLYEESTQGLFAVPVLIEHQDCWKFGVSVILRYEGEDVQFLNTLAMENDGFVETESSGRIWFMMDGIEEQDQMPPEIKELVEELKEVPQMKLQ